MTGPFAISPLFVHLFWVVQAKMQRQSLYPFSAPQDQRKLPPLASVIQHYRSGDAGPARFQHPFFRHDNYNEVTGSFPIGLNRAGVWPHSEYDVRQSYSAPAPVMQLGRGFEQFQPDLTKIDNLA